MSDDAKVAAGPWRAHQQEDGDWEVRAIINEQDHYVLLAFDQNEPVARQMAAAPDLLAALLHVRKLIAEAARTGFDCNNGDWPERLFASQTITLAAVEQAKNSHNETDFALKTAD